MMGFLMKDIDEKEEKRKKEYAAKIAAQKKWFESLIYDKHVFNPISQQEDYFKHYYEQYNGKIIP